jgi:hypothetical protein
MNHCRYALNNQLCALSLEIYPSLSVVGASCSRYWSEHLNRDSQMRHSGRFVLALIWPCLLSRFAVSEPTYQPGVDLPGFDYRSFDLPRPRPRLCQAACLSDERCFAWTFVKPDMFGPFPRCWLKSRVPAAQSNPCCVSGTR